MRRATMKDVATRAGVSIKTVSRVVNLESGVSPRLVSRVREAAQQLDYRHNLAARNLRQSRQRTSSFAVLVQDLSNGYSADLIRAVEDVARGHDVAVVSASLDEEEDRERDLVANLIKRRVDGLILMPASHDQSYLAEQIRVGFGVVIVDRPPSNLAADTVMVDNVGGARLATAHLIGYGHHRIAIITDQPRILTAEARLDGYQWALREAGLELDQSLVRTARTRPEGAAAVHALIAQPDPPTAIFSARNTITEGVVAALQQAGLSHRIALVGFDDLPMADLVAPGITVIRHNTFEVGHRAAELLLARLAGSSEAPLTVVVPTTLITRGSGEIRRCEGS